MYTPSLVLTFHGLRSYNNKCNNVRGSEMNETKVCNVCGSEFDGYKTAKYCSVKCRKRAEYIRNNGEIKPITCKNCGKEFTPKQTRRQKFCNEKCKNDFGNRKRSTKYTHNCVYCGNEFKSAHSDVKYCSTSCQIRHQGVPTKKLVCRECGKEFTFKGRTDAHRCLECRGKWDSVRQMEWRGKHNSDVMVGVGSGGAQEGERNHKWNPKGKYHGCHIGNGYVTGYQKTCYANWDKQCIICGNADGLIDVHHINGDRTDISEDNLIPLCRQHHAKVHAAASKAACKQDYIDALDKVYPGTLDIIAIKLGRSKIAELSGDAETPTRTEGCLKGSQGQRIEGEITPPRGRETGDGQKIC